MPWKESTHVSERMEFAAMARGGAVSLSELCRRFGISRKTGYRWLRRSEAGQSMADRSRRPHRSPGRTSAAMEALVLSVREEHPAWGGRKIARRLRDLGHADVPSPSTVTMILHRHGLIDPVASEHATPWRRFEHAAPNDLWQMDFKGHFALGNGRRCHPLTVLDDHARYALTVGACVDERGATVQAQLTNVFERYGLPRRMLCDNGPPWGVPDAGPRGLNLTKLCVWLLGLGVKVTHGRARHPQTQGKDERFHRTLKAELLTRRAMADHDEASHHFARFVHSYNHERPHEALDMATPASRYRPSVRTMPATPPAIQYAERQVRRVDVDGRMHWQGRSVRVSRALAGQAVGLGPTLIDGLWTVRYADVVIGELDMREADWLVRAASARCARSAAADKPEQKV